MNETGWVLPEGTLKTIFLLQKQKASVRHYPTVSSLWNCSVYKLITSPRPQDTDFGELTQHRCWSVVMYPVFLLDFQIHLPKTLHSIVSFGQSPNRTGTGRVLYFGTVMNWQDQDRKISQQVSLALIKPGFMLLQKTCDLFFLNGKYVAFLCTLVFCSSILSDNSGSV